MSERYYRHGQDVIAEWEIEDTLGALQAEIDCLKAELAEARKDTARLDYCEGKDGRLDRILSCYFNSPEDTTYRDAIDAVADLTAPPE